MNLFMDSFVYLSLFQSDPQISTSRRRMLLHIQLIWRRHWYVLVLWKQILICVAVVGFQLCTLLPGRDIHTQIMKVGTHILQRAEIRGVSSVRMGWVPLCVFGFLLCKIKITITSFFLTEGTIPNQINKRWFLKWSQTILSERVLSLTWWSQLSIWQICKIKVEITWSEELWFGNNV